VSLLDALLIAAPVVASGMILLHARRSGGWPLDGSRNIVFGSNSSLNSAVVEWLPAFKDLDLPKVTVCQAGHVRTSRALFRVTVGESGADCALKMYRASQGPQFLLSAEREFAALTWLAFRNVTDMPRIFRSGNGEHVAVLRSWRHGVTLDHWLDRQSGELTLGDVDSIVRGLCSAVTDLHASGLVHCDIKPSNLVADWDSIFRAQGVKVHLIDFEMAEQATASGQEGTVVKSPSFVGTPLFTAPERLYKGESSFASDIYSCCVVIAVCLTGTPEIVINHIPLQLRKLLSRGLSVDPARRYQDVGALLQAWTSIVADMDKSTRISTPLRGELSEMFLRTVSRSSMESLIESPDDEDLPFAMAVMEIQKIDNDLFKKFLEKRHARLSPDEFARIEPLLRSVRSRYIEAAEKQATAIEPVPDSLGG